MVVVVEQEVDYQVVTGQIIVVALVLKLVKMAQEEENEMVVLRVREVVVEMPMEQIIIV